MGGVQGNMSLLYGLIIIRNLKIQGRFVFEWKDAERLINMVERGLLKLGKDIGVEKFRIFGLQEWENGIKIAAEQKGWDGQSPQSSTPIAD
jgi:hypothetical protein